MKGRRQAGSQVRWKGRREEESKFQGKEKGRKKAKKKAT